MTISLCVLALLLAACGAERAPQPQPQLYGTIIGYTEATTGNHVSAIDIHDVPSGQWPFHAVATLPEGTRVGILQHDENDALVVAPDGTQGWVSIEFIKELKPPD